MKLSVVVPCYNEEQVIEATHDRLAAVLAQITPDFEIIYVDDGSKDKTAYVLKSICERSRERLRRCWNGERSRR